MGPLDLSSRPPRAPHDRLAGLPLIPRTIDKARALLPGGSFGAYWITPGCSAWLLQRLGFDETAFLGLVATAPDDDAIAVEIERRTDVGQRSRIAAVIALVLDVLRQDDERETGSDCTS